MKYDLIYTRRALKDIQDLDTVAKKRLKKALERFSIDPYFYSKKLVDSSLGDYRFRVGDYRVIFDIKDNQIIILRVGHRREIYE